MIVSDEDLVTPDMNHRTCVIEYHGDVTVDLQQRKQIEIYIAPHFVCKVFGATPVFGHHVLLDVCCFPVEANHRVHVDEEDKQAKGQQKLIEESDSDWRAIQSVFLSDNMILFKPLKNASILHFSMMCVVGP